MNNSSYTSMSDGNGNGSQFGITGCGPDTATSNSTYTDATITGTSPNQIATSCSSSNPQRNYYGTLGQLASTTQNVYGVYDMAGGAFEYVMANRTTSTTEATSNTTYMATSPQLKYLDLYGVGIELPNILGTGSLAHSFGGTKPSWSSGSSEIYYNFDVCTWETCGGQALSEITAVQSVSGDAQAWNSDLSIFVNSNSPWFLRSGYSGNASIAGVFVAYGHGGGDSTTGRSFRASLVGF
jgi:hypothetical protein